jgi:import receptor subunit TOM70
VNHTLPTTTEGGDGYYAQAYQLIAKKDYVAACASCEKAVELGCSPAYQSYALNMMGTFNFLRGDTTTALEYLNKAIEANPNFVQNYVKRSSIFMERGKNGLMYRFKLVVSINTIL